MRWLIACSPPKKVYEKKLKRMVDYRVNLGTFTFKENIQDDRFARELFSKWLEMAKYRFSLEHYVWKAEPQARGAIHFHLVSGTYMPHSEVRYTWNRLLLKHGLDQRNANSTDIHAVVGVKNLEAYLTEYLMNEDKHEGRRPIQGKLWGCSHKLSQAGKKYLYLDDEDAQALRMEFDLISLQRKYDQAPRFLDFTDVYLLSPEWWAAQPDSELKQLYLAELKELQPTLPVKSLFPSL